MPANIDTVRSANTADVPAGTNSSVHSVRTNHRQPTPLVRRVALATGVAILGVIFAQIGFTLASSANIRYSAIRHYLFSKAILNGVAVTVELTVLSMLIGIALGLALALMRLSRSRPARSVAAVYIWFFRGSPVLVQLIFWFNLGLIFKSLAIGVPFGPALVRVSTDSVIDGFTAALLGLGLNEGAYMAEIMRSGILAVAKGQSEAARALGMAPAQVMRIVVLPQAVRVAIPPTGNQLINMFKVTSLVSVIGGGDLLTRAENISAQNFLVIELLVVATLWYLALTSVATVAQGYLERRLANNTARSRDSNFAWTRQPSLEGGSPR